MIDVKAAEAAAEAAVEAYITALIAERCPHKMGSAKDLTAAVLGTIDESIG